MRVALIVNRVTANREHNLQEVLTGISKAAAIGAELVMFPEAALTGLVNNDRPARDLGFGVATSDPEVRAMAMMAQKSRIVLAVGLLERDRNRLFDAAALFVPEPPQQSIYRRITPGWHGRRAATRVYGAGQEVKAVPTRLGTFAFLICGDLFDDTLVAKVRALAPDWLLVPMWRCFKDGSRDQRRWDQEELPTYIEQVRRIGSTTLIVNGLSDRHLAGGQFRRRVGNCPGR